MVITYNALGELLWSSQSYNVLMHHVAHGHHIQCTRRASLVITITQCTYALMHHVAHGHHIQCTRRASLVITYNALGERLWSSHTMHRRNHVAHGHHIQCTRRASLVITSNALGERLWSSQSYNALMHHVAHGHHIQCTRGASLVITYNALMHLVAHGHHIQCTYASRSPCSLSPRESLATQQRRQTLTETKSFFPRSSHAVHKL